MKRLVGACKDEVQRVEVTQGNPLRAGDGIVHLVHAVETDVEPEEDICRSRYLASDHKTWYLVQTHFGTVTLEGSIPYITNGISDPEGDNGNCKLVLLSPEQVVACRGSGRRGSEVRRLHQSRLLHCGRVADNPRRDCWPRIWTNC